MGLKKTVGGFLLKQAFKLTGASAIEYISLANGGRTILSSSFKTPSAWGRAYSECAPVGAIINRQAKAFSNGLVRLTDLDGNELARESSDTKRIRRLFTKPNPVQTWNQFISQAKVYHRVYGYAVIFCMSPAGFKPEDTVSMWVLPNEMLQVQFTGKWIMQMELADIISSVRFNNVPLDLSSLIFFQDTHQDISRLSTSYGILSGSRLSTLKDPINNIVSAYSARSVMINKRGAIGILSNEGKDAIGPLNLDPSEKKAVQEDFQQYGLTSDQYQVIITNANLKWQSMTFPTRDLMLFEEIEDDVRQIADSLEYPMFLLGFKEGTTFSNVGEAKKWLYQDVLIPESEDFSQVINDGLNLSAYGLKFSLDFSHIEALQDSAREKNEAAKALAATLQIEFESNVITLNQWRKARGWDEMPDGDKYFFELSGQFTSSRPTINIQQP